MKCAAENQRQLAEMHHEAEAQHLANIAAGPRLSSNIANMLGPVLSRKQDLDPAIRFGSLVFP